LSSLARIPAPMDLMGYVQDLLWSSGELGRSLCRRGWMKPDVWALAPAGALGSQLLPQHAGGVTPTGNANEWLDTWLIAQRRVTPRLCLVAHDPLAPPAEADEPAQAGSGRWDTRGNDSYFITPQDALAPGAVQAATRMMLGDQYVLFVIEDEWPFGGVRPLDSLAFSIRHVIVPIVEGESYGIVSGV
jgi:hypothetical protein